jgi:hypothetical protein
MYDNLPQMWKKISLKGQYFKVEYSVELLCKKKLHQLVYRDKPDSVFKKVKMDLVVDIVNDESKKQSN